MPKWVQFLIAVVLAATVWFIRNMAIGYSDIVSVPVQAISNIEGRATHSSEPVVVSARCSASGFKLLELKRAARSAKAVSVEISPSDFVYQEDELYAIDESALTRYSHDIFGDGVSLQAFVAPSVSFRFPRENCKKVPVQAMIIAEFKPEYMAMGNIRVSPDSVLVYGDPLKLESVENILTKNMSLTNVRSSAHGVIDLEQPKGVRLSVKEVSYALDVTRYVEIHNTVRIGTRNVPAGKHISVLPSSTQVIYRCVFPLRTNPSRISEFYVDYRDFASSINGRCVIKTGTLPDGVIDVRLDPQVCECMEVVQDKL